jgi:tyrosinase
MQRHDFLAATASAAALATIGASPAAVAASITRREVSDVARDPAALASLRKAVRLMRANTNDQDPLSWNYWWYVHYLPKRTMVVPPDLAGVWNACLHHQNYFYAWHRGYMYYFEKALQTVAGDPALALPYWDYFTNPQIPDVYAQKTLSDGSSNPLYDDSRDLKLGESLKGLDRFRRAFLPDVKTFPARSPKWQGIYEGEVDHGFHDDVHNQVGGNMGDQLFSAADPIFYAHHTQIDRLWTAWEIADQGRSMPPPDYAPFWTRTFNYASRKAPVKWALSVQQMNDQTALGVAYANTTLPTPQPATAVPARPPVVRPTLAANALHTGELAATGGIALGPKSATLSIPVAPPARAKLREYAAKADSPAEVVLEGVRLTPRGSKGGYSYHVFFNLPPQAGSTANVQQYFIGSLGSFAISVAAHGHAGMPSGTNLSFALSPALRAQAPAKGLDGDHVTLSFVLQGNPKNVPPGTPLVTIARVHIDGLGPQ